MEGVGLGLRSEKFFGSSRPARVHLIFQKSVKSKVCTMSTKILQLNTKAIESP